MTINNPIGLIGDFIGTVPAMIEIAKREICTNVICHDSVASILEMIPKRYCIRRTEVSDFDIEFKLNEAFKLADSERKLHMIQAHYHFAGLPVPDNIPRPELDVIKEDVPVFDYILSPFSRSLPPNERWQQDRWQQLVDTLPDKSFALIGGNGDDPNYLAGVTPIFNQSFNYISNLLRAARGGLISVVTGTSHLAYALSVKNYLFFNQGLWGKNPEAILMSKNIHDITVDEVIKTLSEK